MVIIFIIELLDRFFLFVGPFLDKHFDMKLWHPTDEASLDKLMNAQVDMYALSFCAVLYGASMTLCFIHLIRLDMHGLFVKKVYVLNKGIVHLIDDIFWNCGFKTESHGEQVFCRLL